VNLHTLGDNDFLEALALALRDCGLCGCVCGDTFSARVLDGRVSRDGHSLFAAFLAKIKRDESGLDKTAK
jgi:hypothetical protein